MKRLRQLVILIVVLCAVVAGVGLYRGWFTVNQAMLKQDEKTAKEKVYELEQKLKESTADLRNQDRGKKNDANEQAN
jgi:hypothetical protein